jgi:hypothetical protein
LKFPVGGHRDSPVAAIEIPQSRAIQVVLGASRRRASSAI